MFPVPEGVLDYKGTNYVGITLWAQDAGGAKLEGFALEPQMPVLSGYSKPEVVPMPAYAPRVGAY